MARRTDAISARKVSASFALGLIAISLMACSSGKRMSAVNDQLRHKNYELEQRVLALKRENEGLQMELQAQSAQPETVEPEVRQAIPHVVEISLGRLTHVRDTDGDNQPDELLAYLEPIDDRSRFTQIVGTLTITVASVPDDGEPATVGRVTLDPGQLRDAYRSAFTGQHYTIQVPISLGGTSASLLVRAAFVDGLTGRELMAERTVRVN